MVLTPTQMFSRNITETAYQKIYNIESYKYKIIVKFNKNYQINALYKVWHSRVIKIYIHIQAGRNKIRHEDSVAKQNLLVRLLLFF